MHPAVAALSLDEKGFLLGAALARMAAPDVEARLSGASGARCAAALAALAAGSRAERAMEIAALTAVVRAPVPAGIERSHPGWLHDRFARESSVVVQAAVAGLPGEVRAVATDVLRARGERASRTPLPNPLPASRGEGIRRGEGIGGSAAGALQRVVFAGLV